MFSFSKKLTNKLYRKSNKKAYKNINKESTKKIFQVLWFDITKEKQEFELLKYQKDVQRLSCRIALLLLRYAQKVYDWYYAHNTHLLIGCSYIFADFCKDKNVWLCTAENKCLREIRNLNNLN